MKRELEAINEKDVVDVFVLDLIDTNSVDDIPIIDYLMDHALATSDPEETDAQLQEPSHADAVNQKYLSVPGSPAAISSLPQHPSPQTACLFPMQSGQFESFQQPEANQSRTWRLESAGLATFPSRFPRRSLRAPIAWW